MFLINPSINGMFHGYVPPETSSISKANPVFKYSCIITPASIPVDVFIDLWKDDVSQSLVFVYPDEIKRYLLKDCTRDLGARVRHTLIYSDTYLNNPERYKDTLLILSFLNYLQDKHQETFESLTDCFKSDSLRDLCISYQANPIFVEGIKYVSYK